MIIILTRDLQVAGWATTPGSNAGAWGRLVIINTGNQNAATAQLQLALSHVAPDEPLCLVGHGNDVEIGDAGNDPADWSWTFDDIARLLGGRLQRNHRAPILIQSCANTVANFSAHTAVRLGELRALVGVWLYGYNRPVDVYRTLPNPDTLGRNVELQGTQVG